eukprot:10047-Heterococcus_DN1.PRE.2
MTHSARDLCQSKRYQFKHVFFAPCCAPVHVTHHRPSYSSRQKAKTMSYCAFQDECRGVQCESMVKIASKKRSNNDNNDVHCHVLESAASDGGADGDAAATTATVAAAAAAVAAAAATAAVALSPACSQATASSTSCTPSCKQQHCQCNAYFPLEALSRAPSLRSLCQASSVRKAYTDQRISITCDHAISKALGCIHACTWCFRYKSADTSLREVSIADLHNQAVAAHQSAQASSAFAALDLAA